MGRRRQQTDELVYRRVIAEPFVVVFPSDHRLAAHDAIELREIVDETFLIPSKTAPTSRLVISDDQIDGRRLAFEGTAGHGPR